MTSVSKLSGLAGAVVLALTAVGTNATPSDAKGKDQTRFRCDARGPAQIRLHAKFEERVRPNRTRKKFNAEFETLPGGSFVSGQQITFSVDSVVVGSVLLAPVPGGELAGELELDSNATPRNGKTPIPPNFPAVGAGTLVEAKSGGNTVLGCELD